MPGSATLLILWSLARRLPQVRRAQRPCLALPCLALPCVSRRQILVLDGETSGPTRLEIVVSGIGALNVRSGRLEMQVAPSQAVESYIQRGAMFVEGDYQMTLRLLGT